MTVADVVIFIEHSPVPSKNRQGVKRIHRLSQTRPTVAYHLWTKNTVDGNQKDLLEAKTDHQMKSLGRHELVAMA